VSEKGKAVRFEDLVRVVKSAS